LIDSGVDVVAGIKGSLITKVLNRVAACELTPVDLHVQNVEFETGNEQGSVLLKIRFGLLDAFFAEIVYKISMDIVAGSLVVTIEEELMSEAMRDHLQGIADGSPYEFGLQDISEYVEVTRCGLKVGGSQGNLLLIGAELSQSQGANWNRFYDNYSGSDLLEVSDLWAVYAKKYPIERILREVFTAALGQGDLDGVDNLEITNIEWPGDRVEVSLKGTYTDCDLFSEIDFHTKAAVTFPVDGSKLFAEARLHDTWLPEEDLIQAGICSLSNFDIIASLLTGFVYLLGKIVTEMLNAEDEVIRKELVNLRHPEVDSIGLNTAIATSTGVVIRGVGPSEVGSGQLYIWDGKNVGKIELTKSIKVPLGYIGHPYEPIFRRVLIRNYGTASLFICSAEVESNLDINLGAFQILSTESDEGCTGPHQAFSVDKNMILLPMEGVYDPYSRTYLKIGFNPTSLTEYDTLYEATLVLRTIIVVATHLGDIYYVPQEERIELTAKYSWYNTDMQFLEPYFFIDKGDILVDAYLDKPIVDLFDMGPWMDLPYMEGTIKTAEIYTVDPVISRLQVQDSDGVVAESTSSLPMKHVSFNMPEGASFTLLVESEGPYDPEPLIGAIKKQRSKRTLLNVVGYAYIPKSRIELGRPVKHISLSSGKLYIGLDQELQIYDVGDIEYPVLLAKNTVRGKLESFTVLPEKMKALGEVVCFTDRGSSFYELSGTPTETNRVTVNRAQVALGDMKTSFKARLGKSRYLVFDIGGFSIYAVRNSQLTPLSHVNVDRRVYDGDVRGQTVILGTDDGIEAYDISHVGNAERITEYSTGCPVRRVKVRGPYIYAETEKETLLLEFNQPGKLTKAGVYSRKYHDLNAIKGRSLFIAPTADLKTILLYKKQRMPPDITRYTKPERQPPKPPESEQP